MSEIEKYTFSISDHPENPTNKQHTLVCGKTRGFS